MRPIPFVIGTLLAAVSLASPAHDHSHHDENKHDHAHHHDGHAHDSLSAHEHGVASLNLVVDGNAVIIELDSPADNLLGFEYLPTSDADKAKVKAVMAQLNNAGELFVFPSAAECSLDEVALESPIFDAVADGAEHAHDHDHDHDGKHGEAHADIEAQFQFTCAQPTELNQVEVALFGAFPGTQRLLLQAIGPQGQQGGELSASQNLIRF